MGCKKTETPSTPPTVVVQEESIKYTLALNNISAGSILEADSLNFGVNISSKLPKDGVSLSLSIKRLDSNITIWSKDTTINTSSLSFNINKITKETDYTLYSTATSKTTTTNTSSVNLNFTRNIPTIYYYFLAFSVFGFFLAPPAKPKPPSTFDIALLTLLYNSCPISSSLATFCADV